MNNFVELNEFKQQVADIYSHRSNNYDDESDFHPRLAHRLIECVGIYNGQKILDIATGTGLVAIEAAQLVGSEGKVVGVDISTGMLDQAKGKIEAAGLRNIELRQADAEKLEFDNSFDRVLCCSALPLMTNLQATLRLWHRFLKPDGLIGLCVFAETAFVTGVVLQKVAQKYSVSLIFNDLTGTETKCYTLLQQAGFKDIEIKTAQYGGYISLSAAKKSWEGSLKYPLCRPLEQLSTEQLQQAKADYFIQLQALETDKGIWNDITAFFVLGRKKAG